jgi:MATE family multidrug resistance protein
MIRPVSVRPSIAAPAAAEVGRIRTLTPGGIREVFTLALPLVLQTLAETAMQVNNSALVGRLGVAELGAIGFAWIWIWTLFGPLVGVATGVQVFVARHDGAGERERCGPWVWQALWLTVPTMIAWVGLLALLLPSLFSALGTSAELHDNAVAYGLARLPGAPALVVDFALSSFFQGVGDTRTPLLAQVIGLVVNVVASVALVFGSFGAPALGVAGAGFAHSLGSLSVALVLLGCFLRKRVRERYATRPVRPDPGALWRFMRTSVPIGGQWLLDMTTFAVFTSIVASTGTAAMAASQAVLQLLSLSYMQAVAIGTASGTLVGRYLGARDTEAARRSFGSAQLLALGMAALLGCSFVVVPVALIGLFVQEPDVIALARPVLALGVFLQVLDAVGIVAAGALRGAGDTRWPFVMHAGLAWGVRLPAAYLVAVHLHSARVMLTSNRLLDGSAWWTSPSSSSARRRVKTWMPCC